METIPVSQPVVTAADQEAMVRSFSAGWLGMGTLVREFENLIADHLGLHDRHVVAVNTGTSALQMALLAAKVGPGDEVITPSLNFIADHQAITAIGARPVLCDIREDNLGLDCDKADQLITRRTKALLPLHYAGAPCDQDGVYRLARKHGLRVIEDACHAFKTTIGGRAIGSYGDLACFSFDPVKLVTSIDGGAIVTGSEEEFHTLRGMRELGIAKDAFQRRNARQPWDYEASTIGFRYHLTNISELAPTRRSRNLNVRFGHRFHAAARSRPRSVCSMLCMVPSGLPGLTCAV